MTNQEKIKYLKQYRYLNDHIDQMLEEKERWRTRAEKMTSTWSDMPKGSDGEDQRELAICKMVDCERVVVGMIDDFVDLGNEIKCLISHVDDECLRMLLTHRYIEGMTFEEVAVKMNYTWRWIHKLHSRALGKLDIVVHI